MNSIVPPDGNAPMDLNDLPFDFLGDLPAPAAARGPWAGVPLAGYGPPAGEATLPRWRWWQRGIEFSRWSPPTDWLLSFAVHAALLIGLACVSIHSAPTAVQSLVVTEAAGDALSEADMVNSLSTSALSIDDLGIDTLETSPSLGLESLTPSATVDLTGTMTIDSATAERSLSELAHRSMTAGRTGRAKLALLSKYGGTEKTEAAVDLGLQWLIRQQREDGSWSFAGPYSNASRFGENRMAATTLSLVALLGAGHTHKTGTYRKQVLHALEWVIDHQLSDGNMGSEAPMNHTIYTHAIATLALSEAYAMTDDSWLRQYVERGVRYTVRAQGNAGGWRYAFGGDSDTSVTGWCMMALVSAKSAGVEVSESSLRRIGTWLSSVDDQERWLYSYTKNKRPTPSMTAEGLLCRMYLGWSRTNPSIDKGTAWLLKNAPFDASQSSYYYWYYATQVLHHAGGPGWEKWNEAMREGLPGRQVHEGAEAGSWPAATNGSDSSGGRLYATCLSLYCLEVYYRHLPLYAMPKEMASLPNR